MPGPGLIADYLSVLAGQLPGPVVEELADGLEETYQRHLRLGLAPDAAAAAAVGEFGDPQLIVVGFTRAHPARLAARTLLTIGPVVAACWAAALIAGRAWTWPVPMLARIAVGLMLLSCVVLLTVAVRGTRYLSVARAGVSGCLGFAALDAAMIIGVIFADPAISTAVMVAAVGSAGRLAVSVRMLRPAVTAHLR